MNSYSLHFNLEEKIMGVSVLPSFLEKGLPEQAELPIREPAEATFVRFKRLVKGSGEDNSFLAKSVLLLVPSGLPIQLAKKLIKIGVLTVQDLIEKSEEELRNIPGVGKGKVWRIKLILKSRGLGLRQ
jgi:hypothetical protein